MQKTAAPRKKWMGGFNRLATRPNSLPPAHALPEFWLPDFLSPRVLEFLSP